MELTKEQLNEVTEWAMALFSPKEIALIMELDELAFAQAIAAKQGDIYKHYMKGRLISEGKIKKAVINLAESGSSPAQTLALKMIEEIKIDEQFD